MHNLYGYLQKWAFLVNKSAGYVYKTCLLVKEVRQIARTKKPFATFDTKEEFDKWYNEIAEKNYTKGKAEGFSDGCTWVLSYVNELFQDMFRPEVFDRAEREIRNRQIERWRRDEDVKSVKQKLDFKHDL